MHEALVPIGFLQTKTSIQNKEKNIMICIILSLKNYRMKKFEISDKLIKASFPIKKRDAKWKIAADVILAILIFMEHHLQNT